MNVQAKIADVIVHNVFKAFCKVDNNSLVQVPQAGPLIIIMNHINFLEVPLIRLELLPRNIIGMVKKEAWRNFLIAFLGNVWGAIALDRERTDFSAFRQALAVLKAGGFLCIAPEGTRSRDGRLLKGQPGVVTLALHGNAPLLPVVHFGGETVWQNLRRIRRTRFHFAVGKPFILKKPSGKITSVLRDRMITEIMYQIALCLPEKYRGYYADTKAATTDFLEFV